MRIVARTSATATSSATLPRTFRRASPDSTSTGRIARRLGFGAGAGWTVGFPFSPARARSCAAVSLPRECAGTLAEDAERGREVLERLKRAREAAHRVDIAVFPDELAVGRLRLKQVPADEQARRSLARQTMVVRDARLAEPSAA